MATRRTTILLDADLLERLDRYAHRERTTKTAIISEAVGTFLEEHDSSPPLGFIAVGRSHHGRLSLDGRSILRREAGRPPRSG